MLAETDVDQSITTTSASPEPASSSEIEGLTVKDSVNEEFETEDTVAKLKKKLDALRRQRDEAEKQLAQDTEEADDSKTLLLRERDDLKLKVDDKEKASLEVRKQVNDLDKQFKAAQRRKSAKERSLQQKKTERQKMRDDIAKWESETVDQRAAAEELRREKQNMETNHLQSLANIQTMIDEAHAESRKLDDEIKDWGRKIKVVEEERKKADQEQSQEEQEAEVREKEEEQAHDQRMNELQGRYTNLWKHGAEV